ncbi:uncharacterized protein LOC124207855 [Daphnia pulex]|uniref:uncharacterized protein LOC124207855 n=1 Tax=Daphnia pulex TaxID=6669 RepID=UPI001EDEF9DA|nr:uncharacterized protein LOC124207855 [Daphnia pulex]
MGEKKRKQAKSADVESSEPGQNSQRAEIQNFAKQCKTEISYRNLCQSMFLTVILFILYVCGLIYECYLIIHHYSEGDYWHCGFISLFVVITSFLMTARSYLFYNKTGDTYNARNWLPKEEYTFFNWAIKWILGAVCLIPRYYFIMKYTWKTILAKRMNNAAKDIYFVAIIWEDAELTILCQFDCFVKSASQLLLNLYVAEKEGFHFKDYSSVFLIISVISLTLSLVSYDQKISLMKGIKGDNEDQENRSNGIVIDFQTFPANPTINCIKLINWKQSALLFFANLFSIVARFTALSLFSSVYGWYIWPACFAHQITIFVLHWKKNYGFMDSLRLSFLHVFAYLHPLKTKLDQEKHPRFDPGRYLTICFIQNVTLMTLWSLIFLPSSTWNEPTFLVPWIVQIVASMFSFVFFYFLKTVQQKEA